MKDARPIRKDCVLSIKMLSRPGPLTTTVLSSGRLLILAISSKVSVVSRTSLNECLMGLNLAFSVLTSSGNRSIQSDTGSASEFVSSVRLPNTRQSTNRLPMGRGIFQRCNNRTTGERISVNNNASAIGIRIAWAK